MNLEEEIKKYEIPEWAIESMVEYVDRGRPMGHFLTSVFANDLFGAVGRADMGNIHRIPIYVRLIYSKFPQSCHGSYKIVENWANNKRKEIEENK